MRVILFSVRLLLFSFRLVLSASFILIAGPFTHAQVAEVNNSTSTPVPGIGHDYIKMLGETVSPANGSLSLRLHAQVPPGRQLTLPFTFAYDSNGVYTPQGDGFGGASLRTSGDFLDRDGWSYALPLQSNMGLTLYDPLGNPNCYLTTGYSFRDSEGSRYPFNRLVGFAHGPRICTGDVDRTSDSVDFYAATLAGCGGTVTVTDLKNTKYSFPSSSGCADTGGSPDSNLPSSVEDRNGNIIKIIGSSGSAVFSVVDTLGRTVLSSSGFGATGNTVTVSGLAQSYQMTWGTVSPNFTPGSTYQGSGCATTFGGTSGAQPEITAITLPSGKQYQFAYDPTYGLLSKITYPTGGYVSYSWGLNTRSDFAALEGPNGAPQQCLYTYDTVALSHRYVSFDGATIAEQQDFSYSTTWNPSDVTVWTSKQTTVTTHDLVRGTSFQTIYTYTPINVSAASPLLPNHFASQIPMEQTVVYKDTNGTTLRTVNKTWYDQYEIKSEQITLENGQTSQVNYTWAGGLISEKDEYDFGQSSPLRKAVNSYSGGFDQPCKTIVYDSSGTNIVAETDTLFDNGTTVCGVIGNASTTAVNGLPSGTHDETNYGPASTTGRGNATKVTRKCLQSCSDISTTSIYDETGQVTSTTDAKGNITQFSYADSYTVLSGGVNVGYTPSGNTNAFLSKITDPLTHTQNFTYDFNNGQLTIAKDQNSLTTTYLYNDALARLTSTTRPDNGQTTIAYNDAPFNPSTPSPSVTTIKAMTSSTNLTTLVAFDGLGHTVRSVLTSDPDCASGDRTDTTYTGLGQVYTVSNPYCTTSDTTYGLTTFTYDALGRTCVVVPPDGTAVSGGRCPATQPTNDVFTSYSGNSTTVTDQAGKSRKSITDGLGRLTQVFEDPAGSNYETDYSYDTLNNLLTVNQKGGSTNSANWRTRTFTYNSLSQLLTAANPESGTISYGYDNNGNVQTKVAPAPNQIGSATVTTTFTYDLLNRITQKLFSDGTTPTVKYGYDAVAPVGCTPPALTITNGIGRRTSMCDAAGAEAWSYDTMGRPLADQRTTNGITKPTSYTYKLDGSVATLTYPSSRIITYTLASSGPNTAGRMSSAVDSTGPINYATAALYSPAGALSSLTNGASIVSTLFYNNRLQPCRISVKYSGTSSASCTDAATGNVLDFAYCFNSNMSDADRAAHNCAASATLNNGNVAQIVNKQTTARTQNFKYDSLNRIQTAYTESTSGLYCWDESMGYDPWGNLLSIGRITGYTCSNEELLSVAATTKNQISGDTYDAAGNLINDGLGHSYTYNGENQLLTTAGVIYTYDGDGKRVQKSNGKLYWYGMGSDPLDETDLTGSITNSTFNEYVFFGGKRIARRDYQNNVNYYFADHLGTARIVANSSGTPVDDSDFYPFGGERTVTSSSGNRYKFTGKERDSESGLDNFGARYDSSNMGRFTSPDPIGGRPAFPQSWNLYAYVANNPLNAVDPTGLDCIYINNDTGKYEGFNRGDCDNSTEAKANTGNYVDGTVNTIYTSTGDSQGVVGGYSGTGDSPGTLISGTFSTPLDATPSAALNANAVAIFSDINQRNIIGNTFKIYGAGAVIGATGGAACYYLCPAASITTLGATVGGTAGPLVTSPNLQRIVDSLFQATDKLPGGTAGAVTYEQKMGDLLSPAGHGQKALEAIARLNDLLKNGTLSLNDQVAAKQMIQQLRDALATKPFGQNP